MNILLTDGSQHFGHSAGHPNHMLRQTARGTLIVLGHTIKETMIKEGYDKDAEVEKQLWMGAVIQQMPGWWIGEPWTVKKYIDEVFTAGVGGNRLMANDGRHRANPTEGYGAGDLLHDKKHVISSIWNAPIEAFTREGDLFEGAGVDGVYLHSHKANEFFGITHLPSLICNDVIKNPQMEQHLVDYQTHLEKVFGKGQKPQIGYECPACRQ